MKFTLDHSFHGNPGIGGCNKVSAGCLNCFAQRPFAVKDLCIPTNQYIEEGSFITIGLYSDFFLDKADEYRNQVWREIKKHPEYAFMIVTKRVERILNHLPDDGGEGYANVIFCITTENQEMCDKRIPILRSIPAKHKWITVSPMIENINILSYLQEGWIEYVEACGEKAIGTASESEVRELKYEGVEHLSEQCKQTHTPFNFMTCGSNFKYNGKVFHDRCSCYHSCLAQGLDLNVNIPLTIHLLNGDITI